MTMRKYLVTIHEDGHATAVEYEEPRDFVYSAREAAYNQALHDVTTVLEVEKARCDSNRHVERYGQGWVTHWTSRYLECEILESAIEKLFRKS